MKEVFLIVAVVFLKMLLSTLVGGMIGVERTTSNKHAGVRTHAILCLSTCALTCLCGFISSDQIPRVIAGVVQGIGFIGAGVIFTVNKDKLDKDVKGLTSSAILWFTGIVGIICGTEYWYFSLPLMLCYLLIVYGLGRWEYWVRKRKGIKN